MAGVTLTTTADVTAAAKRTAITRTSGLSGSMSASTGPTASGMVPTISAGKTRAMTMVSASPIAAAGTASVRLSISSWRVMRQLLAPSDSRMAISCCRPKARASIKLVTFAHAMSSTSPNADISNESSVSIGPVSGMCVARDSTRTASGALSEPAGNRCRSQTSSQARTCRSVLPSRTRPMTRSDGLSLLLHTSAAPNARAIVSGAQKPINSSPASPNPGSVTPTTVMRWRPSTISLPMTAGSAP